MDYTDKYCIIGAGPSGITAGKNLKDYQIPFDIIEREGEIGGNWWIGNPNSAVCHSTHLISSKGMSHFQGYPMPAHYPDYPRHDQMCAYIRDYARHFGVDAHVQFHTAVEWMDRTADGLWDVRLSNGETRRYRGVILANGHLWEPQHPDYPGTFDGDTLHSKFYKTPEVLFGKRVLVVGAGNSGCDIAVEAAQYAAAAYHSTRRGYYYLPKYIMGKPTDEFGELPYKLGVPLRVRQWINGTLLNLYWGDLTRFGLPKPDHKVLETHPTVNQQLIYYIGHGDITPKPDVKELRGDQVMFQDGSQAAIDLIIYATGFQIKFPFIDPQHLDWDGIGPRLYLHAYHRQYDNLFIIGLLQPDGGIIHLMDHQAELAARFIHAQNHNPPAAERFRRIKATDHPDLRGGIKHTDSRRHFLEIEHDSYFKRLKKLSQGFA
jgi:cation diffusion facilitator CzcD-associated flavoprotein CzcO